LPSDPVIVPNPFGKVVPAIAVTLPCTGGQYVRHEPVQFDLVGVSIANQYRVRPCELTSTVPMPVWRVETVVPDPLVAGAEVFACGVVLVPAAAPLLLLGAELPQAVITAAAPASTGAAHQRLRIVTSPIVFLSPS
jgi:hypothetical protein